MKLVKKIKLKLIKKVEKVEIQNSQIELRPYTDRISKQTSRIIRKACRKSTGVRPPLPKADMKPTQNKAGFH